MGAFASKKTPGQVLMVGPPSSGKTTLLYKLKFKNKEDWKASQTIGFQFEEIRESADNNEVGVWDIGGGQST